MSQSSAQDGGDIKSVFLGFKRGFVNVFTKPVFGLKMGVVRFVFDVSRCYKVGYGEYGRMGKNGGNDGRWRVEDGGWCQEVGRWGVKVGKRGIGIGRILRENGQIGAKV